MTQVTSAHLEGAERLGFQVYVAFDVEVRGGPHGPGYGSYGYTTATWIDWRDSDSGRRLGMTPTIAR